MAGKRWEYDLWVPTPKPDLPRAWGSKRSNSKWITTRSDEVAWREGFRFSQALVDHFLEFCRDRLCFVRGGRTGDAVEFDRWQIDEIIAPLLGWVDKHSGRRRFRRSYVELTKKQGKTTIAATLCLYALLGDGEGGPVVISNGPTMLQAGLAFDIAADMIELNDTLKGAMACNRHDRKIRVPSIQGEWKALGHSSGNRGTAQGFDASFILCDELHEWPGWDHWRQVTRAGRARRQPILMSITNAGLSKEGPCWSEHEYACKVLNGEIVDKSFLGFVRQTDEQAAEDEIDKVGRGSDQIPVAKAANPAIGSIVDEEEIIRDIREAFHAQGERGNCLRLTYSVWRSFGDDPWLGHLWGDCEADFSQDDCANLPCWIGFDCAAVNDFTAAAVVYDLGEGMYRALVYYWLSRGRIKELTRFKPDFEQWMLDGWIRANAGKVTDHGIVREDLAAIVEQNKWSTGTTEHTPQLIYDPRMAEVLTSDVADATGCERIEFSQTAQNYHAPCEKLEALVGDTKIQHNGNPVLVYHAENCRIHQNTAEHKRPIRPGKDCDMQTIDGFVALIMALSQTDTPLPRQLDYYENNPVELI